METRNFKSRTEYNNRIRLGHFEELNTIGKKDKYTYYNVKYWSAGGYEDYIVVAVWED